MTICVIGGAGYIGGVVVEKLLAGGRRVVVYDNLSRGHRKAVPPNAAFVEGDHGDAPLLTRVLKDYECDAVMNFSGFIEVGESVLKPLLFYENNLVKGVSLLKAVMESGVGRFIFSSTAAVYGHPESVPINEDAPLLPTNPYGNTKLAFERLLGDLEGAGGPRFVALRYFNAAGASKERGEDHHPETHLIPIILQVAQNRRERIFIYGDDYPTRDGSCVRDYVHVEDLASAHIKALEYLEAGGESDAFNLGSGQGFTVKEVIETARRVTRHPIPALKAERRAGDPPALIASSEKAKKILGWRPEHECLEDVIQSAWNWRKRHPDGYAS